ncbi:MAG TPA: GNAT family N-acetyltransferase [Burkholderiales bacterium]|nr:GNAT family N-acetyltransferase [Burkholderiales bacterium]
MKSTHYLAPLFAPDSVAVIGATERPGAVGSVLMENMLSAKFTGALYAVNPQRTRVHGVACYPSIADIPQQVDLAVIATPPESVPGVIDACGRAGTRSAVVITAGFSETGSAGAMLERALLENARRYGMRLLGPNCLGLMRPGIGLNATFAHGNAIAGSLGVVSQSGAICTALLDWARPNNIGFSSVVSLGGSADLDFGEIVDYLTYDTATEQILLYIEGIRNARRFVGALRAAARTKPVIVMKAGRHPTGVRAAVSHTGALVGADDVFQAAVRRTGAVRVATIGQLVAAAQALSAHVEPRGDRIAIVTNGGGPGVLAADHAADLGLPLAQLSAPTVQALSKTLPVNWSHGNPLDLIGDADAGRYETAVSACLADQNVDGVLAILTPQAMTSPVEVARAVVRSATASTKPLLAVWMGEEQVIEGRKVFQTAQRPVFRTPEPAVELFAHLSAFYRNQRMLIQVPGPLSDHHAPDITGARRIIETALASGTSVLSSTDSKAVLAAFHIPVALSLQARSAQEAIAAAMQCGYPVAMKIDSPDITHKTEVGGVRLDLQNEEAVRSAFDAIIDSAQRTRPQARIRGVTVERMLNRSSARELMVGVLTDKVFGPAVTFAAGGTIVEILRDRAVGLPPLNRFLAEEMIGSTRISRLLGAFRGMPPVDLNAVANVLLRVSEMVCELPWIRELDINPLLADATGASAADARIVIAPCAPGALAYAHLAIHPYPAQLASNWSAKDGTKIVVRPIRPEDAHIEREFVQALSPQTKYLRFLGAMKDLTPAMLARFTQVDYDREMALIAVVENQGRERQIGVARYVINPDATSCEYAIVVSEDWQGRGLGRYLMLQLIAIARARGLKTMIGLVLSVNTQMLKLAAELGFSVHTPPHDPTSKEVRLAL